MTHLTAEEKACSCARNQAFPILFLLCRHVTGPEIIRARKPERLSGGSTGEEVEAALVNVTEDKRLIGTLTYGAHLRLWVWHVDPARNEITVPDSKAPKHRVTAVPESLEKPLQNRFGGVTVIHEKTWPTAGIGP